MSDFLVEKKNSSNIRHFAKTEIENFLFVQVQGNIIF